MILTFADRSGFGAALHRTLVARGLAASLAPLAERATMKSVRDAVMAARPTLLVWRPETEDLDALEGDEPEATRTIVEDAIHFAAGAREARARLLLWSSAEVFGQAGGPFDEAEAPEPRSTWAQALAQAERFAARAHARTTVLRTTAPIASPGALEDADDAHGWIAALGLSASLRAVSPVALDDIAQAVAALAAADVDGLFHLGGEERVEPRALRARLAAAYGVPEPAGAPAPAPSRPPAPRPRAAHLLFDKLRRYVPALAPWSAGLDVPRPAPAEPAPPAVAPGEKKMGHPQPVRRVDKPWGHEIIWAVSERYVGKLLFIRAGERLSLQYHVQKDETVYVLSGKMVFEVGPVGGPRDDLILKPGDAFRITPHTVHRMIAIEDTQVLEASTPELDDVVRLEDKYGRQGTSQP